MLRAIGLDDERASSSVRFSLGKDTTADDIQEATALIEDAVHDLIDSGLRPALLESFGASDLKTLL